MTRIRGLFATSIYEADLEEGPGRAGLTLELSQACALLAAEDRAGRAWSKANAYRGYTSYASLDDLPTRASAFGELKRRLDRHAAAFAAELCFDLRGRRLKLDSMWANRLEPGGAHSGHIHPNSVLSGVVYVEAPEGSGALTLEDPRLALMMAAPPIKADAPEAQRRFVRLSPTPGRVLMWESWLRHEVAPNRSRAPRVSISFNYA